MLPHPQQLENNNTMSNFKAVIVIVGGGPVGLITAHCLSKANIDYVILERRSDTALNAGASNALWPQSVRVFDQLGLLEAVNKIQYRTKSKLNFLADGTLLSRSDLHGQIEIEHGHPWMFLHRGQLVEMLVEHLPDKNRLHFNKHVKSIEAQSQGVKVTCEDGTTYESSIIIGADGVNSTVRQFMDDKLTTPSLNPMTTSYVGVFGSCELLPDLEEGAFYETHGDKYSLQLGPHHSRAFFFIYHRLPKPTKERHHFTEEEKEELVAQYADIHVTDTYKFKDVWKAKIWSHMGYLEEGLVDTWHGADGRIVLIGDAVHKMTPNAGLGFNSGVQSAAALTNALRGVLQKCGDGSKVDSQALKAAFESYQSLRKPQAKKIIDLSGLYTRVVAWDNLVWKLADRYIMPHVNGDILILKLLVSGLIKEGVVLDFVAENNFKEGKVEWVNPRVFADDDETQSEGER